MGDAVLKERKLMSESGVAILLFKVNSKDRKLKSTPEFISRGFIHVKDSQELMNAIRRESAKIYNECVDRNPDIDQKTLRKMINDGIKRFTDFKIKRVPVIIPLFVTS